MALRSPADGSLLNFGDGSDGAVTFDGVSAVAGFSLAGSVYTATRTEPALYQYTNCTVNANIGVKTGSATSLEIRSQGDVTIGALGYFWSVGRLGGAGGADGAGQAGTAGSSAGSGGGQGGAAAGAVPDRAGAGAGGGNVSNGSDGQAYLTTPGGKAGTLGNALWRDNSAGSHFVAIPDHANLRTADFTVEFWTKAPFGIGLLIYRNTPGDSFRVFLAHPSAAWVEFDSMSDAINFSYGLLSADTWHHIAASYQVAGGLADLYVDGVRQAGGTSIGAMETPGTAGDWVLLNQYFITSGDSYMDELVKYNRRLSQSEIQGRYNGGIGRSGDYPAGAVMAHPFNLHSGLSQDAVGSHHVSSSFGDMGYAPGHVPWNNRELSGAWSIAKAGGAGGGGGSGTDTVGGEPGTAGGRGGGAIKIVAAGSAHILGQIYGYAEAGTISAGGGPTQSGAGGGGAGGSVLVQAHTVTGSVFPSQIWCPGAAGGLGNGRAGGNGAGGCARIEAVINNFTGTVNIGGGSNGVQPAGAAGVYSTARLLDDGGMPFMTN